MLRNNRTSNYENSYRWKIVSRIYRETFLKIKTKKKIVGQEIRGNYGIFMTYNHLFPQLRFSFEELNGSNRVKQEIET